MNNELYCRLYLLDSVLPVASVLTAFPPVIEMQSSSSSGGSKEKAAGPPVSAAAVITAMMSDISASYTARFFENGITTEKSTTATPSPYLDSVALHSQRLKSLEAMKWLNSMLYLIENACVQQQYSDSNTSRIHSSEDEIAKDQMRTSIFGVLGIFELSSSSYVSEDTVVTPAQQLSPRIWGILVSSLHSGGSGTLVTGIIRLKCLFWALSCLDLAGISVLEKKKKTARLLPVS